MLLGIFSAKGVLPLDFKPAHSVGDLVTQHLDELEQEAERKGGVLQALAEHFAKVYRVRLPISPITPGLWSSEQFMTRRQSMFGSAIVSSASLSAGGVQSGDAVDYKGLEADEGGVPRWVRQVARASRSPSQVAKNL
jgi:hypothetical protein